ncbi:Rv2175c family DNA-binding protein [Micrococcoides hystricis]|uniref:Rv2175c family DNA-binding protein n=1 Tax=Micrococcoides hystricis TaxID=1572761 RepID=A0ABV6P6P9_9MICC
MELTELIKDWRTLPDIAELLDVKITKVHRLLAEDALLAHRIPSASGGNDLVRAVPAAFIVEDGEKSRVLESLRGTITLLRDARYSDEEALRWLFTVDESLNGSPLEALRNGHKTEVRRRAQALAW